MVIRIGQVEAKVALFIRCDLALASILLFNASVHFCRLPLTQDTFVDRIESAKYQENRIAKELLFAYKTPTSGARVTGCAAKRGYYTDILW